MRGRARRIGRLRCVAHHARSSQGHMLGAGTLGALPLLERYRLAFAEVVETNALAGRLMEEILAAVLGGDEAEPFVRNEPLDRALGSCHRKDSCNSETRGVTRDCADRMALMSAGASSGVSAGGATVPGKRGNIVYGDRPHGNRTLRSDSEGLRPSRARP